jgi:hypothetical protein
LLEYSKWCSCGGDHLALASTSFTCRWLCTWLRTASITGVTAFQSGYLNLFLHTKHCFLEIEDQVVGFIITLHWSVPSSTATTHATHPTKPFKQ